MKKVRFIICAVMALALLSCEKDPKGIQEYDPMESLSESVVWDFNGRYPEATDITVIGGDKDNARISLIDKDGYENEVVYVDGEWAYSQKWLDVNDFLWDFPLPVRLAYAKTGITHETFYNNKRNSYVLEVQRAGFAQKQYEIACLGYYLDGDKLIENLAYHIVIAQDGTLLTCGHRYFGQSIWLPDLSTAVDFVCNKYPGASVIGATDDGELHVYIRHEGLLKTVTFHGYSTPEYIEWWGTEYALPMDTTLPAHVLKEIADYEAKHPGEKWFELSMMENREGFFYGLRFGTELEGGKFYASVNE